MQRLDFNLLQALDALLQEGSVRGAAERLNLTTPAMSHALSRLRSVLGDPLLVRAGQRLVPTPRAVAIRDQVRQTVESGRSILQDRPRDALMSLSRTFTVRANDSTISVFGSGLAERLQARAPDIRIRFAGRSVGGCRSASRRDGGSRHRRGRRHGPGDLHRTPDRGRLCMRRALKPPLGAGANDPGGLRRR